MAIWCNDNIYRAQFAQDLINHANKRVTTEAGSTFLQVAKNGGFTCTTYETFFDSPWANSAEVEYEHKSLYQVRRQKEAEKTNRINVDFFIALVLMLKHH